MNDTPNESATTETATPPWGDRTPDSLWDEVKQLRQENAERRQKYRRAERALEGLDDETREVVSDFLDAVRHNDTRAITHYVSQWAEAFGITKTEVREAIADAQEEKGDRPLTAKDLERIREELRQEALAELQEAEKRRQTEAAAARITSHAEKLGYSQKEDPIAWKAVLGRAMDIQTAEGCSAIEALDKAHAEFQERDQRVRDQYVAERRQEAQRRPAPSGTGSAPARDSTPKTLKEADKALRARLGI